MIALDMRGHGETQWADGDYSIPSFVGDIAAFVRHLGVARIHLVGLSLGGIVAMTYAGMFADKVSKLVLVDIGPELSASAVERVTESTSVYPDTFESLDSAVAWALTDYLWANDTVLKNDLAKRLYQRDDKKWGWKVDLDLFSPANRKRRSEEVPKRWTYFAQIGCPILEVRGALSDLVSADIVQRMQQVNSLVHCVDVADAGHNVIADQPKAFADVALPFLDSAT